MITSQNQNYKLNEAHQQDKFGIVGGRENLVCDSLGNIYPMGGVAPVSAPTAEVITGGGSLTPNIGYSYAISYENTYQDCETAPSPVSAFIGRKDQGDYKTIEFSSDGKVVYVVGEDLKKSQGYYNGQTLACEIVNDEYVNVYSQWQYRSIEEYTYDPVNERGMFTINRPFFNVDPDKADQQYTVKIDELETEEGIVGGKSQGKNKLILDKNASQNPADYRYKTIHIVQGKGKGQKRLIVDASQREDGLIEITVDAPWKEKPKYVDPEKGDTYQKREKAEAQDGTKRGEKYYKQYYSSEYVISDPLRFNGLAIDCNVISSDDKGRRVKLSGLGHSDGLITGKVVKYQDNAGTVQDTVTVELAGDTEADQNDTTYANKRFRIFLGAGAGLDCRIAESKVISENRVKLTLDTYGKLKKDQKPNGTSEFVIYAGELISASYTETGASPSDKDNTYYPRVMVGTQDGNGNAVLYCCAYQTSTKTPDLPNLAAQEARNVETYNSGRCFVTFAIIPKRKSGADGTAYYITRPIERAETNTIVVNGYQTCQTVLYVSGIPKSYGYLPTIVTAENAQTDPNNKGAYYVYNDNLQDGIYTGWIAAFYNQQDTFAKGKKKVKTARVAGYLDATGEVLLCNGVPGVGEGWQAILFTEYTRSFGSRVKVYEEDSTDPSYTSATNTRFFTLDYFASPNDDEYKDWTFEFLYGHAKKVKGKTIYQQDKNKKTYSVYAYDGQRRRIDCAGDENYAKGVRMKPAPIGNEFVALYDEASYIYKVFDSNDSEADDKGEGSDVSSDGIKMKVSGITQCPLPGFDKIKLYRASETTGTYRLCAVLENKAQTFIDNVPETELTTELDFAHSAPTPAQYIASRNSRFALAGSSVNSFTPETFEGAYVGTQKTSASPAVIGVEYSGKGYNGSLLKNGPFVGIRCSSIARLNVLMDNESVSENLRLQIVMGADTSDGVICGNEKRVHQSTLDNRVYPGTPGSATEVIVEAVSEFYLNPTAANTDNAYDGATLRIAEALEDGEEEPNIRYLHFGTDIKYTGSSRKCELQNGLTIKLRIKAADLGVEYKNNSTSVVEENNLCYVYDTMPYSVYKANWQIYYADGTPYVYDGYNSAEITSTPMADGEAVLLDAPLPAMLSDSFISIDVGGDVNARQFGTAKDVDLYYMAFRRKEGKDPALLSYILSTLAFEQKWDWQRTGQTTTGNGKAFGTVAPLEANGTLATLYVEHNNEGLPLIAEKDLRCFIPDYALLVFAKPGEASGSNQLIVKDGYIEIQFTTPGAGTREKVELSGIVRLDDGYGTRITGIVPVSQGFLVFKDRGVYLIDPEWQTRRYGRLLTCITHEYGCIAPGSIAEGRSGIFWLSSGGRVMRQPLSLEGATTSISKELQVWFDGDEDLAGTYVDTANLYSKVEAEYDADYGYYIMAIPAKKRSDNSSTTVILMFDETLYQWYRLDDSQSHNSVNKAFRYEGRAAFAGGYGIYDFKPDRTRINPWKYASRWRDDGNNDRFKLVKRLRINNETSSLITGEPTANVTYYKEQKADPEINVLSWVDGNAAHPFYTNIPKAQVEAGVRCYEWRFVLEGSQYVNIKNIDTELRVKDDKPKALSNTPNEANL